MAEWELTHQLGQFLDRHLVLPLLEFLSTNQVSWCRFFFFSIREFDQSELSLKSLLRQIYEEEELSRARLDLLNNTNMVDFAIDFWKRLNQDQEVPQEFLEKRQKVLARLRELEQATAPIIALITKEEVSQEIAKTRDARQLLEFLQKNHGVSSVEV